MKIKHSIAITGYISWCGLGFIRGMNDYKYTYNKYKIDKINEPYLYINSLTRGFFGIILYSNPALIPFLIYKELYRLEINLRNLENEKNSDYYKKLI